MNENMKKEILAKWNEWKYDVWDSNKNTWTQRDQAIAETIDQILLKELAVIQELVIIIIILRLVMVDTVFQRTQNNCSVILRIFQISFYA